MEPIFGFILYFAAVCLVAIVAGKRGLRWWAYVAACVILAPAMAILVRSSGGTGMDSGLAAFLVPAIAFVVSLTANTSARKAVLAGENGEYRKCPFCAEAVRREAVKCKHCSSELEAA